MEEFRSPSLRKRRRLEDLDNLGEELYVEGSDPGGDRGGGVIHLSHIPNNMSTIAK